MRNSIRTRTLIIICGLFSLANALGAESLPVFDPALAGQLVRAGTLAIRRDPGLALKLDEIQAELSARPASGSTADQSQWTEHAEGVPSFSYTKDAVWLRFAVRNTTGADIKAILALDTEYLNEIEVYGLHEDQADEPIFSRRSGRLLPFEHREFQVPKFAFRLNFPAGRTEVFIRVRSHSALNVPLFLLTPESYTDRRLSEQIFLGVVLGLMALLFAVNVVLYVLFRDRNILSYLFYLATTGLFVMTFMGYLFKYLWPNMPVWNATFNAVAYVLCQSAGLVFLQTFFRTRLHILRIHYWVTAAILIATVTWLLIPFFDLGVVEAYTATVSLPFTICVSTWACLKIVLGGHRIARFYIAAWIFMGVMFSIYLLQVLGFLPTRLFGLDQMQYPVLAFILEMVFFPLALADRLAILMREQNLPAREAKENPAELSRLTRLDLNAVDENLRRAMEHDNLYREELSLGGLAGRVGISEKDLSEYLNKHRQRSFYNFLNGYRIQEARRLLLEHPRMKIIEIAQQVGFNSLSTFNAAFARESGMSPSKFRSSGAA